MEPTVLPSTEMSKTPRRSSMAKGTSRVNLSVADIGEFLSLRAVPATARRGIQAMSRRALRLGYFIRGRRRIGKSALVEAFIDRHHVPSVFYTAEIGFRGRPPGTWPRRCESSRGGLVAAQQSHQEWGVSRRADHGDVSAMCHPRTV